MTIQEQVTKRGYFWSPEIDAAIEARKIEMIEFDRNMFEHLGKPKTCCNQTGCIYCNTWAEHLQADIYLSDPEYMAEHVVAHDAEIDF